jgi:L-ribulose-5-phosphate 3-epimerase
MESVRFHRRDALRAALGSTLAWSPCLSLLAGEEERLFKIGACDWSIGGRGQPAALKTARDIGLDGVQVSFGRPGEPHDLRRAEVREEYQRLAGQQNVEIASLAMGILNEVPYAIAAETEQWVVDCVEVLPKLNVQVVLLAFFSNGDLNGKPELQQEVARRLKKVAPLAEKAGAILGIESWLSAEDHIRILDAVGSPAVQVYYDVANSLKMGYDIYREIRQLGRERICEIHCKENESLLGKGPVDFVKVKQAVDEIGYRGWLIIEGAVDGKLGMRESYVLNQKFLRSIFPTSR